MSSSDLGLLSDTLALVLFLLSDELSKHANLVRFVLSKIKTKALGCADLQQVVIERLPGDAYFSGGFLKRELNVPAIELYATVELPPLANFFHNLFD